MTSKKPCSQPGLMPSRIIPGLGQDSIPRSAIDWICREGQKKTSPDHLGLLAHPVALQLRKGAVEHRLEMPEVAGVDRDLRGEDHLLLRSRSVCALSLPRPDRVINLCDPDARVMRTRGTGFEQLRDGSRIRWGRSGEMLLMPPSLAGWLPEDHLVWTVSGEVDPMDLDRFAEAYRLGAAGRPAYDPQCGGPIAVRVRARESVLAGDRAGVLGGRGVQGDHEAADAGSFDDRGVPPPA